MPRRPDMTAYFRGLIDVHVNGMMARRVAPPLGVKVEGDVTDRVIKVTTRDGHVWLWAGGGYSSRKINGCYAPRMPRPVVGS